jgi:hypothetical protein
LRLKSKEIESNAYWENPLNFHHQYHCHYFYGCVCRYFTAIWEIVSEGFVRGCLHIPGFIVFDSLVYHYCETNFRGHTYAGHESIMNRVEIQSIMELLALSTAIDIN